VQRGHRARDSPGYHPGCAHLARPAPFAWRHCRVRPLRTLRARLPEVGARSHPPATCRRLGHGHESDISRTSGGM